MPYQETVFFADIAGSTRLYEEHGDEAGQALLLACLEAMVSSVERCGGHVVERVGDEILCTFARPDDAARAAATMHLEVGMAYADGRLSCPMRVRIGFEHGDVIDTGERVFGSTVHSAARVVAHAKAGQTLTTRATLDRLGPTWQNASRLYDQVVLKGQSGEQELHELVWNQSTTSTFQVCVGPRAKTPTVSGIDLFYGEDVRRVDPVHPRLDIGRDLVCDLVVRGASVSHLHAHILWQRGRPWIQDVSTNGTVIEPENGAPAQLHHETAPLHDAGVLRLGATEGVAVITYRCESL